jgi:hypothetical protein
MRPPRDVIRDAEAEVEGVPVEVDPEAERADHEEAEGEVVEVHEAGEEVAREDKIRTFTTPIVIPSSFLFAIIFFLSFVQKPNFFSRTKKYSLIR